jgi:acetyltransferase-like isoleucine patch superfamily enzyme
MSVLVFAYKLLGVNFINKPRYIHYDAYIDVMGGIDIYKEVVISTKVIILSHDYSYNVGIHASNHPFFDASIRKKVILNEYCFIGAGAIILPGSKIGAYSVIGAGAVVKGDIPPYSIVVGNPAKIIGNTKDWGEKIIKLFPR